MKRKKYITSAGPSITEKEIEIVNEAIRDGWQNNMNLYIDELTIEFSSYVGIKYCLPTSHCTAAIHLALLALNIKSGDEVIVPDLTWVASASPITYVGATPVFADVDPISLCLSAESLEKNITDKTKAIIVVDLLGNMPEWDDILYIAKKYDLVVIEDAAEGIGASYKKQLAGTFGDISLFSFNATKMIMSGQGGAFCTNDQELYSKAKLFSHHGINKELTGKYYWSNVIGYNYNYTNIQAALALAQLRRIDDLISYKRWLFDEYKKGLSLINDIILIDSYQNVDPTYWISTIIFDEKYNIGKEIICDKFKENSIDMRPLFYPISSMPPFKKYCNNRDMEKINPISYKNSKYGICLPNGNNLDTNDVEYICETMAKILNN